MLDTSSRARLQAIVRPSKRSSDINGTLPVDFCGGVAVLRASICAVAATIFPQ
jgi:hypothetical protein